MSGEERIGPIDAEATRPNLTPTPVPSEVAETTAGEREVEALAKVLGEHLPRDNWGLNGESIGTYCTCGKWQGDYFADGEAGPFDLHLATHLAALLDRVRREEGERIAQAIDEHADRPAVDIMHAEYLAGVMFAGHIARNLRAASVGRGEGL